jgi:hypothetical protein
MKNQIIAVAILFSSSLYAQEQTSNSLLKDIPTIQKNIENQNKEIESIKTKIGTESKQLQSLFQQIEKLKLENDSLSKKIEANSVNISSITEDLGTKIQTTETNAKESISKLDKDVEKNRLYWIIATLVILLFGGFLYRLLRNKMSNNQTGIESQILEAKLASEDKIKQLDDKLVEIYDKQLKIVDELIKSFGNSKEQEGGEKDHSLVLKVADEVTKIQMNLEVMDKEIRGYKHLKKYSETILDNLKAYGYEIPQLIGMNYNSGMNMVATLEFDESIESGKQIIKRIIKPQVNFDGKVIQTAKVTVAFNE